MIKIRKLKTVIKQIPILSLCLVLALLLLPQPANAAVDPVGDSENYSAVLYNNTNGLPTSEANAIAQTSEGFIWIGSYAGLIRYDGNTFERLDSTTGISSVVYLYVDSLDRLWIGTNDNGVALMEDGEFRFWKEEDGLGSSKICTINEDEDGTIFVGTTSGITMIHPDFTLEDVNYPGISNAYIERIKEGSDGLLYCLTNEDDYFTLRSGKLVEYTDHTKTSIPGITCILPDENDPNKLFIGTEDSAFYYGNPKSFSGEMECFDIAPLVNVLDIEQIGNQTWICARNGIGVIDDQGFRLLDDLPMDNSVGNIMTDYEGNLWFTSTRQGVMKLVSNRFSNIFTRYNLPSTVVNTTCMYDDKLFIGTDTGLIVLKENGPVSSIPLTAARTASGKELEYSDLIQMFDNCRIRSIIRDSKERLWISLWRAMGLVCYDQGKVTVFAEAEGLISNQARIVCEAPDGSILAGYTGGISVIKDDRIIASYGRDDGLANQETLSVCAAPNGDIIVGSDGGGIYIINGEGTRCIDTKNGLSSGIVMRVKYDSKHNLYWIVTSNSIAYMTLDYQVTTVNEFPYSNNFDMYENSKGDMWILSSNGIYVLPTDELIANGEIKPVHYSMANGLPCIATSNSYSELTPDGDLYIAGNSGVAKVNIESSMENVNDLKQAVPYIDADGTLLYPDETGGFTIPSDVRKLTIYGYVYNYSLTDPQVSYQLEGFDQAPVTLNRSELDAVTYTNLPGGSYNFVMELKDALGRGSKKLSVPIVKEKALYEQLWFYGIIALCAALLLNYLIRSYVRRKMRALEEKHQEEATKERIASELQMANQIQVSMLPHDFPPFPDRKEFDIYASMAPAREVGGDFYDFFMIDDDHLCLVMADVSGKGIPAALFMMVAKAILKSFATMGQSAAQVLAMTNERLCSNNQLDMFVTVWLGILEISTGKLTAANAGHEYPVVKKADGPYTLLKDKHGLVIGGMDGIKYKEYELSLAAGDRLFLYTDGVPEATDADKQMFGTERMIAALNEDAEAAPRELLENVRRAVDDFVKDAEQFDDLTMLCLEYSGNVNCHVT